MLFDHVGLLIDTCFCQTKTRHMPTAGRPEIKLNLRYVVYVLDLTVEFMHLVPTPEVAATVSTASSACGMWV